MACSDDRVSLLKAGMCKSDQPNECGSDFMNGSFFSRILGEGVTSHHDCKVTFFSHDGGGWLAGILLRVAFGRRLHQESSKAAETKEKNWRR